MYKPYNTYKAEDFLADDYFVDMIFDPTPESGRFWKKFIDENMIDVNEFIQAYSILKNLHENKSDVPDERLSILWKQIKETNQKKIFWTKHSRFIRYASVACCTAFITGLSLFMVLRNADQATLSITDFAKENTIHREQPLDKIQLISGDEILAIDDVQAKVEYDASGKLEINKQAVAVTNQSAFNQLKVPYGKRAFLKLPDGTLLWVNTGSTVIYPTVFDKDKREIYVEGEVYAEVFHDSKHPFIIKTEKLDVQVLGTSFNLSAYREDERTDLVLVSGKVNVIPKNGTVTAVSSNQLFSLTNQTSIVKEVDVENFISWHDGNYIFYNEPIESILLRLSRYYNVTMILPTKPSGISCSGRLELKDDLLQLLKGLSDITDMNFAVKDNKYTIVFKDR